MEERVKEPDDMGEAYNMLSSVHCHSQCHHLTAAMMTFTGQAQNWAS